MKLTSKHSAWIFTLGTEVARGLVVNTNAVFIGRRLSQIGFVVEGVVTLVDSKALIADLLRHVLSKYSPDLIVTTGGLGPTHDDITLEAVGDALSLPLKLNNKALEMLREKLASRGYELTEERKKMAYLPEGAEPIPNPVGTAPGAVIKHGKTVIVCLPGVPREMEEMWHGFVERIATSLTSLFVAEGSLVVAGVPEASLSPILRRFYETYSSAYIKSHPRGYELTHPLIEIYMSAASDTEEHAGALVREICVKLVEEITKLGGSIRNVRC